MEESFWYVRIRGEVLGPFHFQKVKELARRGYLSRIHEVSQDAKTWEQASAHPEFFPMHSPQVPKKESVAVSSGETAHMAPQSGTAGAGSAEKSLAAPTPPPLSSSESSPVVSLEAPPVQSPVWYYQSEGKTFGPLSQTELRRKLNAGEIPPNTLVWNERLPAWCPAAEAFQYLSPPTDSPAVGPFHSPKTELPESLCSRALRIKPWTVFLTVMYWVTGGISFIAGLAQIIRSSVIRNPYLAIVGISSVVTGVIWFFYGLFMYNYSHSLGLLRYGRNAGIFEKNLEDLHKYFVFKGFIYIVAIIFVVILCILFLFLAYLVDTSFDFWNL